MTILLVGVGRIGVRRFKATTGLAPGEWLLEEQLSQAKILLDESQRSIDDVAEGCGLGTAENLRRHFRRRYGASPGGYHARFAHARHPAMTGKSARNTRKSKCRASDANKSQADAQARRASEFCFGWKADIRFAW